MEKKSDDLISKEHFDIKSKAYIESYDLVKNNTKKLAGKILTIIDGSIAKDEQNKAVKDLIRSEIKEFLLGLQLHFWKDTGMGESVNNILE